MNDGAPPPNEALDFQVDPGELDYRHYELVWCDGSLLAAMVAARTAGLAYPEGYESWSVVPAALAIQSSLEIRGSGDKSWAEPPPEPPPGASAFVTPIAAQWSLVTEDLASGALFEHESKQYYLRIAISEGNPPTLSALRWYQESKRTPAPTVDPSGRYQRVTKLGEGTFWYADSYAPR